MNKLGGVIFVSLLVLGAVLADPKTAAASSTKHTPQEQYLAQHASGNFACRVNTLQVSTLSPGTADVLVSPDALRASFANVATLEWAHIAQTSFSALDGRNEEKVLGTAGGDMGEFIQALHAFTKASSKQLDADKVQSIFERYLKVMTRQKFFYETDERSYVRLAVATGCKNLRVADMGGMRHKKQALLEKVAFPEHIGDPFIRFMATNATGLGVNPDYIQFALAAYHKVLWTSPSVLSEKLCYLEMKGNNKIGALVHIRSPPYCTDQGLAPMVSQQLACPSPVLINHPDAVKVFRRELVSVMTEGEKDVDPRDVLAVYNELAETNLEKFWSQIGAALPTYSVEFFNSSPLLSKEVSFVDDGDN